MFKPLLIEIGVEELPAIPFLKELPNIEKKWEKILEENSLLCEFSFFYTPRRLVLWHPEFPTKQNDFEEELFGAPVDIAFKDGKPTKAALSFAKKCGVDVEKLGRIKKGNREVLYFKRVIEGKKSEDILKDMIIKWLKTLNFGRSMRWGSLKEEFIRPIRWSIVNFGNEFLKYKIFGVESSNFTYGHRSISLDKIVIKDAKDYFEKLKNSGVILFPDSRREKILDEFERIEKEKSITIEKDEELLDEIVAITEYPTALIGEFDNEFLKLPPEVIITSMKEHQRYFPVFKDENLYNGFVVVSNAYTDDFSLVIKGNERVLKARLSDALFFWEKDLEKGLDIEGLKNVVFMDELGSLFDKEIRELKIAQKLFEKYIDELISQTNLEKGELLALCERAVMLSKADLLTEMVYEFTELQGVMGYYYALMQGEDELVALSIKEQYLPNGEDSELPTTLFSSLISIAVKLDTLMSLFSIGKIPTGSRDPFGLRRAANAIIRIILNEQISFDISKIFEEIKEEYKEFDTKKLEEFFIERIYQYFDVNPSVIKSVIESGERDLVELSRKIKAVNEIVQSDEFKDIFTTFKRVANIVKDIDLSKDLTVDENLFESKYEKELFDRFNEVVNKEYEDYESKLDALFGLKPDIDRFFDHVLVNVEDSKLRENRKNLIASIYKAFRDIAEIKEITV
ncbi:glycine--tRNA ligase subunit beta [Nitrosophilus kaiyonis]|uniref:glycine--tRNA ligase subunit beta n=1 Tax=Nitrosophilus kaiyonis TaxID=2930200 RepID=UPI002491C52E|nr:glycine--tRNA ligase subunit beta [Nitrosophilus kaiyonis]